MPRRSQAIIREVQPDAKYDNITISRLINRLMTRGKKSTAERIAYGALQIIEQQESSAPVAVLEQAVRNVTPILEVKSRRVGGATYQVPVEVRPNRAFSLALRWLVASARARTGKSMGERLAAELIEASKGQGATVKKRDDIHRMAEANRAFAHYKW